MSSEDNKALVQLQSLNLPFTLHEHEPAFTVEEQFNLLGERLNGFLTKNLFLRCKTAGLYVVVAKHDLQFNFTKFLPKLLSLPNKTSFRMGAEELMQDKLGVGKGALSALSAINNVDNDVTFVIDATLTASDETMINLHPLRNDQTVSLSWASLSTFFTSLEKQPTIVNFADFTPETSSSTSSTTSSGPKKSEGTQENR